MMNAFLKSETVGVGNELNFIEISLFHSTRRQFQDNHSPFIRDIILLTYDALNLRVYWTMQYWNYSSWFRWDWPKDWNKPFEKQQFRLLWLFLIHLVLLSSLVKWKQASLFG